jgi:hypothetical protein
MDKLWSQEDIEELAQEITARQDFENAIIRILDRSLEETRPQVGMHDRSEMAAGILNAWIGVLLEQEPITKSAAFGFDGGRERPDVFPKEQESLWDSLSLDIQERVRQAVRGHYWLSRPLKDGYLMVAPCAGSDSPVALAVTTGRQTTSLVRWMVNAAAARIGFVLSILQSEERRDQGYREMAARVAHMTSGSILLAQLQLDKVLREEGATAEELRSGIEETLSTLEEAQKGLDRARLLGVPWQRYRENIRMGEFVAGTGRDLNRTAGQEVVRKEALDNCLHSAIVVSAARVRLRYALRDLMLGAWILTNPTGTGDLKQAIDLSLTNGSRDARVSLIGGKLNMTSGISSGRELERRLRDPDVFLLSPDDYRPERSIGFHMAWKLIEEMGGSIHANLAEGKLSFVVELPLALGKDLTK